jgi:hypothetical protein
MQFVRLYIASMAVLLTSQLVSAMEKNIYACEDALVASVEFENIPKIRAQMEYYNSDPWDGFTISPINRYIYKWMVAFPNPSKEETARLYARIILNLAQGDREDFYLSHERLDNPIVSLLNWMSLSYWKETWIPAGAYLDYNDLDRIEKVLNGLAHHLPLLINQLSKVDEGLKETRQPLITLINEAFKWEAKHLNSPQWHKLGGRGSWVVNNRWAGISRHKSKTNAARRKLLAIRLSL